MLKKSLEIQGRLLNALAIKCKTMNIIRTPNEWFGVSRTVYENKLLKNNIAIQEICELCLVYGISINWVLYNQTLRAKLKPVNNLIECERYE